MTLTVDRYLAESREFFLDFHRILSDRIQAIQTGAQGDSAHVSQWLAIVAKENIENVLTKFNKYEEKIPKNHLPQWIQSLLNYVKPPKRQSVILHNKAKHEIIAKITEQLNRALEFLEAMNRNSQIGARTIPVKPHIVLAVETVQVLRQGQMLLTKYRPLANQVLPRRRKSWFVLPLVKAIDFIAVRVCAYGLDKKDERAQSLKELDLLYKKHSKPISPIVTTKATRKIYEMTDMHDKFQLINENSLHYMYVPNNVHNKLGDFCKLMSSSTEEEITVKSVLESVSTNFPKPTLKYGVK